MRYHADHKQESRLKLIAGAGRGFRKRGFGGIGVDGLAKEAQVTSGSFYFHFSSKDEAFREALTAGLDELRANVERLQGELADGWLESFVDFYVNYRRTCDLSESCALQSLTSDVIRGSPETHEDFERGLESIATAVAAGLHGGNAAERKARAFSMLSILSGGVTIARAVANPVLSDTVAKSIKKAAIDVARGSGLP